jgi:hypothetical protein
MCKIANLRWLLCGFLVPDAKLWCDSMQSEDLRQAVVDVLNSRLNPRLTAKMGLDTQLKTAVDQLAYEDWTIDYDMVGFRLFDRNLIRGFGSNVSCSSNLFSQ